MAADLSPEELQNAMPFEVAKDLDRRFHCGTQSALLTINRHFTFEKKDIEACEKEIKIKRNGPCLVGVDIFSGQKQYTQRVAEGFYPVTETSFPFFSPQYAHEMACAPLKLTWSDVMRKLNEDPARQIGLLILKTDSHTDKLTLEEQYIELILKEELYDPVAFISFMDGILPLIDYVTARQCGVPADVLDKQMSHSTGSRARVPAVLPTYEPIAPRGPQRRRLLLANSPITSVPSRQNKWNAQQVLKAHGLNYLRSVHARTAMEAEVLRVASGIQFPVVVKPVSGAGSEFVTVCHTASELTTAFGIAKGVRTTQSTDAAHMTVEEYIAGPEYVVNTVTYNGISVVTDVWRSFKYPMPVHSHRMRFSDVKRMEEKHTLDPNAPLPKEVDTTTILYDRQEFVSNLALLPADCEVRRAVDYTLKCLNALGMRNGASHCEVRVDARPDSPRHGQPVLIELNPRVLGDVPRVTHLVGYDQVTLLFYLAAVAAAIPEPGLPLLSASLPLLQALPWPPVPVLYTSGPRVLSSLSVPRPLTVSPQVSMPLRPDSADEHTSFVVFLAAQDDGALCGPGARYVSALPTFVRVVRGTLFDPLAPNVIAVVRRTTDLFSSPGACVFEGRRADVERDVEKLRAAEKTTYAPELAQVCREIIRIEAKLAKKASAPPSASVSDTAPYEKRSAGDAKEETLSLLLAALQEECARVLLEQNPPPLYVPSDLFNLLRYCGLATLLHV